MLDTENLNKIKNDLGANFKDDTKVLIDILEEVTSIATNISHLKENDKSLFPYIKRATIAIYIRRGSEGKTSLTEGSISETYTDIIQELKTNIITCGLRRMK